MFFLQCFDAFLPIQSKSSQIGLNFKYSPESQFSLKNSVSCRAYDSKSANAIIQ